MDVDEEARFELHEALREKLGDRPGGTLMSLLPPVGWADIATKQDLEHSRAVIDHRFDTLEQRLLGELQRQINRQTWRLIGAGITIAAVLSANNIL